MEYEWDSAKAASNAAKHGVSFDDVRRFDWDTALVAADIGTSGPEVRLIAIGYIGERLHVLVFVIRRAVRIISLRRASRKEIARYEA